MEPHLAGAIGKSCGDATIWVAVRDEPLRGKGTASFLFGVLTQELAPFELTVAAPNRCRIGNFRLVGASVMSRGSAG